MANYCARCLLLHNTSKAFAEVSGISSRILSKSSNFNVAPLSLEFVRSISVSRQLRRSVRLPTLKNTTITPQQQKQRKYSDDFIQQKVEEYELGVRRLAVIMGEDPATFTQKDVNRSIRYLFPSDLTQLEARPQMEHPSKVYPPSYRINADQEGRPYHYLFYTKYPELFQVMNETYNNLLNLQRIADNNRDREDVELQPLNLIESRWMDATELKRALSLDWDIDDQTYRQFQTQMERLTEESHAGQCKRFIMKFRVDLPKQTAIDISNEICTDEIGRQFVCQEGKRKTALANVKLIAGGSGKITINGEPFDDFFVLIPDRETVITPFSFLKMQRQFDVEATIDGGFSGNWTMLNGSKHIQTGKPKSAMAGAIRLAISRAILAFIDETQAEQMRRAGLLTYDVRTRERKKPGQKKARKKFTWKKR